MRSSSVRRPACAVAVLATFALAAAGCGRSKPANASSGNPGQYGQYFEVNVSRPAGGTIASQVNGQADGQILCGTSATKCGPVQYPWDAVVTFVATPDPSYKFVTWAADCTGTTVDTSKYGADKWIAAGFEPVSWFPGRVFLVSVHRPMTGTISSSDGHIRCGTTATVCGPVPYLWADTVTLTAAPDAGYLFQGWTDSCATSGTGTCVLTTADPTDKTVGAAFTTTDSGGSVVQNPDVPGVVVTVPPGALDTPTPITISVATSPEPPPPGVDVLSPVYKFEPDGTIFADVVKVALPVPTGATGPVGIYWKKHLAPGYDYTGGSVENGAVEATVTHFSDGFVGPAMDTRTIQGTRFLSYLGSGNKLQNVPDSANLLDEVAALIPNGSGGYDYYPGTAGRNTDGTADGTFAIENVPPGTALVQIGLRYVETAENTVALTRLLYGRPDMIAVPYAYPPGPPPMPVAYNVTNLEPWQYGDEFHLFSPDADTLSWDTQPPGIVAGSSAVTGARDLSQTSKYLPMHEIDGTGPHQDVTFLIQLSGRTSPNGYQYLSLSRFQRFTTFDLAPVSNPSLPSRLSGFMGVPAVDKSLALDWDLGAFDAAIQAAAPATFRSQIATFLVLGEPNALQYGVTARTDKRTFLKMQLDPLAGAVSTGAMPFAGTPREDLWGLYWIATASRCCVQLQPPPGPVSFAFAPAVQQLGALSPSASFPTPDVTPVMGTTINGDPLDAPRTGVGLAPTIAWTAPSTGANVYTVFVYHLVQGPPPAIVTLAIIDTTLTSLALPPGLLGGGEPYAVTIRAAKRTVDVTRPVRMDLPLSMATTTSQWFIP